MRPEISARGRDGIGDRHWRAPSARVSRYARLRAMSASGDRGSSYSTTYHSTPAPRPTSTIDGNGRIPSRAGTSRGSGARRAILHVSRERRAGRPCRRHPQCGGPIDARQRAPDRGVVECRAAAAHALGRRRRRGLITRSRGGRRSFLRPRGVPARTPRRDGRLVPGTTRRDPAGSPGSVPAASRAVRARRPPSTG
jgi:hypothetical protein